MHNWCVNLSRDISKVTYLGNLTTFRLGGVNTTTKRGWGPSDVMPKLWKTKWLARMEEELDHGNLLHSALMRGSQSLDSSQAGSIDNSRNNVTFLSSMNEFKSLTSVIKLRNTLPERSIISFCTMWRQRRRSMFISYLNYNLYTTRATPIRKIPSACSGWYTRIHLVYTYGYMCVFLRRAVFDLGESIILLPLYCESCLIFLMIARGER